MSRPHLLVIEDELIDTELLCRALEARFPTASIFCMATAEEALSLDNVSDFSTAFVNLKLQGDREAGIGVIKHFRGLSSDIPLWVVSGVDSEEVKLKAFQAGASGFFQKNFTGMDSMEVFRRIEERAASFSKGVMKGSKMKSWKTRLGGSLAGLGTFLWGVPVSLSQFPNMALPTDVSKWCILLGILATGAGVFFTGLYARDHHVSDEQAGAGRTKL